MIPPSPALRSFARDLRNYKKAWKQIAPLVIQIEAMNRKQKLFDNRNLSISFRYWMEIIIRIPNISIEHAYKILAGIRSVFGCFYEMEVDNESQLIRFMTEVNKVRINLVISEINDCKWIEKPVEIKTDVYETYNYILDCGGA